MATKVKLRKRPISGDRHTLYLDFYPAILNPETGKQTRREFLGLYLFDKPKNPFDKQCNKETMLLAENVRAKRQIEIQAADFGFFSSQKPPETNFVQFFSEVVKSKAGNDRKGYQATLTHLERFAGGVVNASNITEAFCNDFRGYLLLTVAPSSANLYLTKFKTVLKQAHKKGLFKRNLTASVESIKRQEVQRQYLTMEQLQLLVNTPCHQPIIKRAALFSALTGLRFSDIAKLTWSEVQYSEQEGYFLQFRQQKTKGVEVLPISVQAAELLGERKEPESKVFHGLKYSVHFNNHLKTWVQLAGITKNITFHCFRHTYATLQLSHGTDIYTVSKMLGHRELKTTQLYTKIIDKTKRQAANAIKLNI